MMINRNSRDVLVINWDNIPINNMGNTTRYSPNKKKCMI